MNGRVAYRASGVNFKAIESDGVAAGGPVTLPLGHFSLNLGLSAKSRTPAAAAAAGSIEKNALTRELIKRACNCLISVSQALELEIHASNEIPSSNYFFKSLAT